MKLWRLLPLLAVVGCGSPAEERDVVAYRGPEVSIDVHPVGRAERFVPGPAPTDRKPIASPGSEAAKKVEDPEEAPKPRPRKRTPKPATEAAPKPKPKVEKPKEEPLPPDEDFYPSRHDDQGDGFDPGLYPVPDSHTRKSGDGDKQ